MKDPNQVMREGEQPKNNGRVKINVGGTIFETTISTLTRLDDTVLSEMVANRWRNEEELFVDRNPTYFGKVLDYLRDGEHFALPTDHDARKSLRREAEFYNIPDLAKMCPSGFRVGDCVQWRESAIVVYWKWYVRYEYNGTKKSCPTSANCGDCNACGSQMCSCADAHTQNTHLKNYDEWRYIKHEMRFMKGNVTEIISRPAAWLNLTTVGTTTFVNLLCVWQCRSRCEDKPEPSTLHFGCCQS